jgi:hypothetical protein
MKTTVMITITTTAAIEIRSFELPLDGAADSEASGGGSLASPSIPVTSVSGRSPASLLSYRSLFGMSGMWLRTYLREDIPRKTTVGILGYLEAPTDYPIACRSPHPCG